MAFTSKPITDYNCLTTPVLAGVLKTPTEAPKKVRKSKTIITEQSQKIAELEKLLEEQAEAIRLLRTAPTTGRDKKKEKPKPPTPREIVEHLMEKARKKVALCEAEVAEIALILKGEDVGIDAWIAENGIKLKQDDDKRVRQVIDREVCLDVLPDGLILRASGKHMTTNEVMVLTIKYNSSSRDFTCEDTGTTYPKLQDANRVWREMRDTKKGGKLGNAWEDFRAVNKYGKVKSVKNLWKDNWFEGINLSVWVY